MLGRQFTADAVLIGWSVVDGKLVEVDGVAQIVDFSQARQEPELTILSAVMHARSEAAVACGRAAMVAVFTVPREHQQCYLDLVSACLTEDQMAEAAQQLPPEVEYELCQMELESYAYAKGRKDGRKTGVEEGREEGREEGSREALQAACAALVTTLHATLTQRGIELDWASRARIERCQDLDQLSVWLVRAATATSADDVFDRHA